MIEFFARIYELTISGEQAVSISAWCLTIVTALDAKVGVRIYTRTTILINLLTGKVAKHDKPATRPDPLAKARTAKTLNAVPDRYTRA
jgi:hypothetical protein